MSAIKKFLLGIIQTIQDSQRLRAEALVRHHQRFWAK
jgi:hypothetical protein